MITVLALVLNKARGSGSYVNVLGEWASMSS